MTPSARLTAARETLGWSGHELARRLGCDHTLVRQWETERRPVPAVVLAWLETLAMFHGKHPAPEWRTRTAA